MDQEVVAVDLWQAFNPLSLWVGFAYGAVALALTQGYILAPAVEKSEGQMPEEESIAA